MKNLDLLIQKNNALINDKLKIHFYKGKFYLVINHNILDHSAIKVVLQYINILDKNYKGFKPCICFVFPLTNVMDKLSYIILECIVEHLICNGYKVEISMNYNIFSFSNGFSYSPILSITNPRGVKGIINSNYSFHNIFNSNCSRYHYRKVLSQEEYYGTDLLSKLYDSITYFQRNHNIFEEYIDVNSEVVVELLGNAIEHSNSDCLLDIDISYGDDTSDDNQIRYVNVVIVDFSETLLGDGLHNKIKGQYYYEGQKENYLMVENALKKHRQLFDPNYDENDFYFISAFQNRISGRVDREGGGTGLTKFIKSLQGDNNHSCYVFSGNRVLNLNQDELEYKDNWIGFNKEHDYFNHKPNNGVLIKSDYFLPGTAFNICFTTRGK